LNNDSKESKFKPRDREISVFLNPAIMKKSGKNPIIRKLSWKAEDQLCHQEESLGQSCNQEAPSSNPAIGKCQFF
jgi:hypothetical protein